MSYAQMRAKYRLDRFGEFLAKWAFLELDAAIEEYWQNGKADDNGGMRLDPSDEQLEMIIDAFLERFDDYVQPAVTNAMRNAIQAVTGLVC